MSFPVSSAGFRPAGQLLADHVIAHLRLALRLPLTVTCSGEVRYYDTDLEQWSFERRVTLGTCETLIDAMILVSRRLARGDVACSDDPALALTPQLIAVLDAEQGLVIAGEVSNLQVTWCQPVTSDAEARAVVILACRQRAEAQYLADLGRHAEARGLHRRAASTEGRLVDPFWRDSVKLALLQRRAA